MEAIKNKVMISIFLIFIFGFGEDVSWFDEFNSDMCDNVSLMSNSHI